MSESETSHTTTEVLAPGDNPQWEAMVKGHPMGRCVVPLQAEHAGWQPVRIAITEGPLLVGGLVLGVRKVPGLPVHIARAVEVMIGPERHGRMLAELLAAADRVAADRSIIEIELRLRVPANDAIEGFEYYSAVTEAVESAGYRAMETFERTYLLRIDQDDDALLTSFSKSCRGTVRRAIKDGADVVIGSGAESLDEFYEPYAETCRRKGAPVVPRETVVDGMAPLVRDGKVLLCHESYAGTKANIVIVDALGVPTYLLGTRTQASVDGEVPSSAQVLQYEIMKHLRDNGKRYYDLGGCEGPTPEKGHPNYGVWRFKHGFRGQYVEFMPYYRKTRGVFSRMLLKLARRLRGDCS